MAWLQIVHYWGWTTAAGCWGQPCTYTYWVHTAKWWGCNRDAVRNLKFGYSIIFTQVGIYSLAMGLYWHHRSCVYGSGDGDSFLLYGHHFGRWTLLPLRRKSAVTKSSQWIIPILPTGMSMWAVSCTSPLVGQEASNDPILWETLHNMLTPHANYGCSFL